MFRDRKNVCLYPVGISDNFSNGMLAWGDWKSIMSQNKQYSFIVKIKEYPNKHLVHCNFGASLRTLIISQHSHSDITYGESPPAEIKIIPRC